MGYDLFLLLKNQRFSAILLIESKNVQSFLTELRYGVTLFFYKKPSSGLFLILSFKMQYTLAGLPIGL